MAQAQENTPPAFKAFECPVCLEVFKDPKMLPACGHSLCKVCLFQLWSKPLVTCPQCRMPNRAKNIDEFKTNFGLKEACEIIKSQQQTNTGKESEIGMTCPHVKMVPQKDLHHCEHCKLEFCQHCILNHKMIIKMETELISCDFEGRISRLPNRRSMGGAKRRVKKLFDKVREDINNVLMSMENEWISHIDAVSDDIETASKNEDVGEAKKQKLSNTCGIYDSLSDILKTHEEVSQRDQRLKTLEEGTNLPNIDSTQLKGSISKLLKDMKLSRESFIGQQTYVPNIMEVLYNATINNDIKVFQDTMENEKLPPNAAKFVLNYSFPKESWSLGAGALSDKIPHLAALKGNLDILDYLVDKNFSMDNVDRNGKFVSEHLFSTLPGKSARAEKIHVRLFESELVRKRLQPNNYAPFIVSSNWLNLVRDFFEKYGVPINGRSGHHGFTCLHEAIARRNLGMFNLLMKHSPNVATMDFKGQNVLHVACGVNFHQIISVLMTKQPQLLESVDNCSQTPLLIAANADHLESFQALAKYYDINKKLAEWLEITRLRKSNKIFKWLQSLNQPRPTEA